MSSRSSLQLSTRSVQIYSGAADAQARADIAGHVANNENPHDVTAEQIGLGDADNTSDANKPVSGPQAAALALKAPLASPALSGVPTAPTAPLGTVSDQVATTAFAQAAANAVGNDVGEVGADLDNHLADHANPHQVTKAQVGLALVDNTADAAKPVSAPQQAAINTVAAATAATQTDIDGHQANTSNPHSVTKIQVGLGSVDNTADLAKPVSTAQQTAINVAAAIGTAAQADIDGHQANVANPHATTKAQVGLANVDNTSDLAKPVSTATQTALNLKAPLTSPALTGTPTAPTAAAGTSTTQLATTAFTTAATTAAASAADAAQADATQALADAAGAQAAAEAAQADATAASDAAAAAQSDADAAQADASAALDAVYSGGEWHRPGDAVELYGQTKTGPAVPIDATWVATSADGSVVRVNSATAADPQTIAPITAFDLLPGRVYECLWKVRRQTNPADPLNDSVTCGVQWLTSTKASNGALTVSNIALTVANGLQQRSTRIGIAPGAGVVVDHVAPAGSIYFRPYVDMFGDSHVTDVVVIDVTDVPSLVRTDEPANFLRLGLDGAVPGFTDAFLRIGALSSLSPTPDSAFIFGRRIDTASNAHGITCADIFNGPSGSYNPFDARPQIEATGSAGGDHVVMFQARPDIVGTADVPNVKGFHFQPQFWDASYGDQVVGFHTLDPKFNGTSSYRIYKAFNAELVLTAASGGGAAYSFYDEGNLNVFLGNVGIGINTPGAALDFGGARGDVIQLRDNHTIFTRTTSGIAWFLNSTTIFPATGVQQYITNRPIFKPAAVSSSDIHGLNSSITIGDTSANAFGVSGEITALRAAVNAGLGYTGTLSRIYGLHVVDASKTGGSAVITGQAGIAVDNLATGTNNTQVLLGTTTIPAGDWALYSASSRSSAVLGGLRVGTTAANLPAHTNPYLYIPGCTGQPSGIPADAAAGAIALCYDLTAHKLWAYDQPAAAWRGVALA